MRNQFLSRGREMKGHMRNYADEVKRRAQDLMEQITKDRRALHRFPEIGTDLPQTSAYIKKRLDEMGIEWKDCGGVLPEQMTKDFIEAGFPRMEKETGVTAVIGHGSPCILLRADMDALPVREDNDLEFKSCNENGHMCGHDSHAAMLLGAAQTVGYTVGVNSASLDTFIVKIHGKGGHSSQPQLCVDPLMIMNQVYQALNLLVTRETDPAAMATLTCGVAKGGTAVNIIPDEAELHIGLRTLNVAAADHLIRRIPEVIDHYIKAWNGEYDLTVFHTPCTLTDEALCRELVPHICDIAGEDRVKEIPAMTGTEDFGYVTKEVPGMFAFVGAGKPGNAPLHSPKMILDEKVLPLGAAIYANAAVSWLEEHGKESKRSE